MIPPIALREALNVTEAIDRDRLVRLRIEIRKDACAEIDAIAHWNRTAPAYARLDDSFFRNVVDWCDGKRALPMSAPTPPDATQGGGA